MHRKRLLWQLFPSYLLITLLSLAAVTWYASNVLEDFYLDQTAADLQARAKLAERDVRQHLLAVDRDTPGRSRLEVLRAKLDPICKSLGQRAATRVTVILPDGEVAGDTEESPARMKNHGNRPEVREALGGRNGRDVRLSDTLKKDMMYLAVPVRNRQQVIGVLRTSIPVTSIDRALRGIYGSMLIGGLIVAAGAAGVSLLVSRRISRPLEELKSAAERFAEGDLDHKLPTVGPHEIGELAETMNQMAADLDDRIRTVEDQRNERQAILSSMVEGVLAFDVNERLISLNEAGARLLGIDPRTVQGRSLLEIVRNAELQTLVTSVLTGGEPMEGEFVLHENRDLVLQAHGTVLRDAGDRGIGVLVVLHDVTRIKQLEQVRHDFVANVSHELKTPVTSIKGFVETLLDGAMHNPDDTQRFLQIVAGQTDRLGAIIDDLLDLSRIEKEVERAEIVLSEAPVKNVLETAVELCLARASEKDIRIELTCDDDLQAALNPPLLEQAVVNLIDNAVKYSPHGQPIHLDAARTDSEVVIRVRDHGCGIGQEHLPRLFERFYRVDKARSRKLGGTGLGLAIVKHIAQAHGGRATVQSKLGEGSTFFIHLPAS